MRTVLMGKRGTLVIPAKIRKQYGLEEGTPLLVEEAEGGFFFRPVNAKPPDVEIYTPERLAEFFLNNAMDEQDYLEARKDVESMGLDPDAIDHLRRPA